MFRSSSPKKFFYLSLISFVLISFSTQLSAVKWLEQESEHFIVIYRPSHDYLVPHILTSAEKALIPLTKLFNYQPSEKIIINTYDFSDYGRAGTTTVPQNFIRLQIEPLELGYEYLPFTERFQWLISHELVHVVVNDQATNIETVLRFFFSKVNPEATQPMSIFYSLLTNHARYSPRWHQEGIAVFMETWFNGGYGRILGNFDEMYFRSKVAENSAIPTANYLDAKVSYESFLIETLFYLYGARFTAYLAQKYGYQKLVAWYTLLPDDFYNSYEKKFEHVFEVPIEEAWQDFIEVEQEFQRQNLERLKSAPLTSIKPVLKENLGWVTSAYLDSSKSSLILGYHRPHQLTTVERINFRTSTQEKLGTLPSPTILQISSTAYDRNLKLLFYTANNNKLFRDLYVLSTVSKKNKLLFRDCRVGQITVSPLTHELWGVRHQAGRSDLVFSVYPYRELVPIVGFEPGNNLQHLAISPSGRFLAAVLHQSSGRQALILSDLQRLREGGNFSFQVISEDGSPEYPSWSPDEKLLYWNAYTNGVSNVYCYNRISGETQPMSHTLRGLFKPLYLNADSLFAFEFTSEGFRPVIIPNQPAQKLPAIRYFGQKVVEENPKVTEWAIPNEIKINEVSNTAEANTTYSGLKHLHFQSFIPVVTGFQSQIATGIFTHLSDPLFIHDLTVEAAVTPKRDNPAQPRFHIKGQYKFKQRYRLGVEHNAPNFYDLVNERKRGMIGNKFTLGHTHFWKYDIPHKIKQKSEIAMYTGIEAINDNLVRVSRPDFAVLQSSVNSDNVRRSIGNVDDESGPRWTVTGMFFGVEPFDHFEFVGGVHSEFGYFTPWAWPHNILHIKLSGGYRYTKDDLSIGKFYFGGFGNRYLDKGSVKQYRKVFRFPGIPIYSLPGERFVKGMFEHTLPPIRPGNAFLGQHFLSHIDFSWYTQGLWLKSPLNDLWVDVGAQVNFGFHHWFNLKSTFSAGIAQAWSENENSWEWFVSLKLLK